ncbi:MAG: FtsH protease activity modulator HflK [Caulobacterales bacterium]|uniref:FtsH protease activity modulator HflK n=1 Tax=Glycocaulis sp. TaxID=1969725 RepID=UPI003F9F4317
MPWNDNAGGGGGPWGSGGGRRGNNNNQNPWGQGPNGGRRGPGNGQGGGEPDLEQFVAQLQARIRRMFGGSGGGKSSGGPGLGLIAAGIFFVWLAWPGSAWYVVGPQQAGVVLRFGEYVRTTGAGLQFKLPVPFETVLLPEVTTTNEVAVGSTPQEALMLTRDENIVEIDFVVQWRVDLTYPEGVRDFLFNVRDPQGTVKAVAESAMREVVGTTELQPIITQGRTEVARRARQIIQDTLASYDSGIQVLEVQLREASAPASVIDAFRDVDAARQDAERAALQATAHANQVVPEARGDAVRLLEEARGYRESVIAEAEGQASRFNQIYAEYRLAPDVTRRRIFLETMEQVLGRSELIILDQNGAGSGAVPYLPLDQLGGNRSPARTQSGSSSSTGGR